MVPYVLLISTILLKTSFSFQKLETVSINQLLSDPFYRSLYIPLTNFDEKNVQKISDIFNNNHLAENDELNRPLKSHMKVMYGIDLDKEAMRTRKREPFNQNEEMMRTRKREPMDQNEMFNSHENQEPMRTRKREPFNQNEEMMRTRKREPFNQNEEMMRTRKREPFNQNEMFNSHENQEPMRTRKREPFNQNEMFNSHENQEPMRTRKREPYPLENVNTNQSINYNLNFDIDSFSLKRKSCYNEQSGYGHKIRKRETLDQADILNEAVENYKTGEGVGLPPIKRFDFNNSVIEHFFEYDSQTLSNIVMEILDQRSQENYDNAFIEVFKVLNKDSYDEKPLHEKVFLFRKFLRLYKEFNDETLRGVMFDLPKKMKNYAVQKFLNNNPKGRDYLKFWETEEEIDIRFRNLYQQFQYALIERNYEMEQQLYELACPHGYTESMMDFNMTTNSAELLSIEAEEKRLRKHAKRYLRRKLNSVAMLSTTTADPYNLKDVQDTLQKQEQNAIHNKINE